MSMDVSTWKISADNLPTGQVTSFIPSIDQTKVVTKALNGAVYVQTIGTGVKMANVGILADALERDTINTIEASGQIVSIVYRDTQYLGLIESAPDWSPVYPGQWFTTTLKFIIQEEVSL